MRNQMYYVYMKMEVHRIDEEEVGDDSAEDEDGNNGYNTPAGVVLLSGGPWGGVPSRSNATATCAGVTYDTHRAKLVGSGNGDGSVLQMGHEPLPGWA